MLRSCRPVSPAWTMPACKVPARKCFSRRPCEHTEIGHRSSKFHNLALTRRRRCGTRTATCRHRRPPANSRSSRYCRKWSLTHWSGMRPGTGSSNPLSEDTGPPPTRQLQRDAVPLHCPETPAGSATGRGPTSSSAQLHEPRARRSQPHLRQLSAGERQFRRPPWRAALLPTGRSGQRQRCRATPSARC